MTEAAIKHIKHGKLYLIPASTETRGHLTTGNAKFYAPQLQELLRPRRSGRCDLKARFAEAI